MNFPKRFGPALALALLLTLGCNPRPADGTAAHATAADSATPPTPDASTDISDADDDGYPDHLPAEKPAAELKALEAAWEAAEKAERKFLGSPKIEKLVGKFKVSEDEDGMPVNGKLAEADFEDLTVNELVYYCAFNPESWDQICAEIMFEPGRVEAISPNIGYDADYDSDRQVTAWDGNKTEAEAAVKACLDANKAVSRRMLRLIVDRNIAAVVPSLIDIYQAQTTKDDLILSTLIELMEKAEYGPWKASKTREICHDPWTAILPRTGENAEKVMTFARKFHGG